MLFFKKRKKDKDQKNKDKIAENENSRVSDSLLSVTKHTDYNTDQINAEPIELEILPQDFKIENYQAHEITDLSLISRLNVLMQGGTQQILQNAQTKAVKTAIKNSGALLHSDIPVGKLTNARGVQNGYRATLMGKKGIEKNAILTEFDGANVAKSGKSAVRIAGVMNIASLIVGQYYMKEISTKLNSITSSLNAIKSFQEIEFKSRIKSLGDGVMHLIRFKSETLETPELRRTVIEQLNRFKNENIMLLNHVNMAIQDIVENGKITKIREYELKVKELETQLKYQVGLNAALEEISKLVYLVNLGDVSLENSFDQYKLLIQESNNIRNNVTIWHNNNVDKLHIDLSNDRFKKNGLEGLLFKPLSILINDKWDYKKLDSSLKQMINAQKEESLSELKNLDDIFEDDVIVINKDSKYYYILNK